MADLDINLTPDDTTPLLGAGSTLSTPPPPTPTTPAPVTTAAVQPATAPPAAPSYTSAGIAGLESGGKADATNPLYPVERGGPLGKHQFLASTWGDFVKANPTMFAGMTPDQILAKRSDPAYSDKAADWYAKLNEGILTSRGIAPTAANLGIAHALGGGGAAMLLAYPDSAKMADVLRQTQPKMAEEILRLNPQYQTMSVGDLKAKYAHLGGGSYVPAPAVTAPVAPAASTAAATPPTTAGSLQTQLAGLQKLAQMQKLAALSKLLGGGLGGQQNVQTAANARTGNKTGWADQIIANARAQQNQNPLNTYQTLAALSGSNPLYNVG